MSLFEISAKIGSVIGTMYQVNIEKKEKIDLKMDIGSHLLWGFTNSISSYRCGDNESSLQFTLLGTYH